MARILVLDDNVQVCKFIRQLLEKKGYEVFEAYDGEQGLKFLRENHADLAIIDIFMPEQGGISTMMQIRSEFPGMKMVVISGGGGTKHVDFLEMAREFGADRILQKPFPPKNCWMLFRNCCLQQFNTEGPASMKLPEPES